MKGFAINNATLNAYNYIEFLYVDPEIYTIIINNII